MIRRTDMILGGTFINGEKKRYSVSVNIGII